MAKFEIPDMNVMTFQSEDSLHSSGDEFPFVPFSENEDELDFASFN